MIDLSAGASSGRRVLLYSNDSYGNGHLRQSLQLADRLVAAPDIGSVLITAACPQPLAVVRPPGVDLITLPSVIEEGATYRSQTLGASLDELVRFRAKVLSTVVDGYQPDLILVDDLPVGFEAELWPVLRGFVETQHRPRLVLGVRDVVDSADRIHDEWSRLDAWRVVDRLYDRVLVYGDELVTTTATELRLGNRLSGRVRHVGYLGHLGHLGHSGHFGADLARPADNEPDLVLVTGDERESGPLLDAYAAFLSALPADVPFRAVEVSADAGADAVTDVIAGARAVIAHADYPTVCAVLAAGVPALIVPRLSPSQEDALRAERLAAAGLIETVAPHALTADRLRRFVAATARPTHTVAVDGLDRVAEEASALLAQPVTFGPAPAVEASAPIRLASTSARPGTAHRVGYVLERFPTPAETVALNELIGLDHAGVDVRVLSLGAPDDDQPRPARLDHLTVPVEVIADAPRSSLRALFDELDHRAGPDGARQARVLLHRLPGPRGVRILDHALQVAAQAAAAGLDHLHAHFMQDAAYTTLVAHILTGIPFSVGVHSADVFRHNVDREAFSEVAVAASAIVTACEASKRHIVEHLLLGREARIEVVHCGASLERSGASGADRIGGLVIGVGRLEAKKGFDVLVEACAQLLHDGVDIGCAIVGAGPQRDLLAARIRAAGIGDRVRLAGALPHEQVLDLIRKATVVAAPGVTTNDGDRDALPTPLLEAMACGTPVVATPVAGVPELVDDGVDGILVPTEDPAALALALRLLVDERDTWRRLSAAAVAKVRDQFEPAAAIGRLAGILATELAPDSRRIRRESGASSAEAGLMPAFRRGGRGR